MRFIYLAILFALMPELAVADRLRDEVVAVVDGQAILRSELDVLQASLARQGEHISDMRLLLERRIEDLLVAARAESLGIRIGEKQLDETIENIAAQNKLTKTQLYETIVSQGLSTSEYREMLREQMLRMQIIQREIEPLVSIDQADLVAYMKTHRDRYATPPEVELRLLNKPMLRPADVTEALMSVRPTNANWRDLTPAIQEWVSEQAAVGAIRYFGPTDGMPPTWVQLTKIRPPELRPLAEVEDEVYERVRREKIERAFQHWLSDLKAKTWVERFTPESP